MNELPNTQDPPLHKGDDSDDVGICNNGSTTANDLTDLVALLEAASCGDNSAWTLLVSRYARRVYALAKSRCRNHDVAEEIAQSVFATVAEKLGAGDYNEEGKFESWLFRVAANRVRDYIRRVKRRPASQDPEVLDTSPARDVQPAEERSAAMANRLRSAMDDLSDADREIVELRHHGGMSFKQIADMLDEPLGTLLARHHRALKKLKESLADLFEPDSLPGAKNA